MSSTSSICVCFSKTDRFLSRAVRWFTQSEVSHCFITFKDRILDQAMVLEVDWRGFRLVPWQEFAERNILVARYTVGVPEERQLQSINKQIRYLGTGYNYFSLLAMMLRRFRKWFHNPFSSSKRLICSEAVAIFLNSCGAVKLKHPGSWTPKDLYLLLQEDSKMFRRVE